MKHIFKIFLLFILITPIYSVAQQNVCSDLTKQQIIHSIIAHPNLKYELNFKCFKKLNIDDINMFYSESEALLKIINKYSNNRPITNFGIVLMSLAVSDLIALPIVLKLTYKSDGTAFFVMAGLLIPAAVVGVITYYIGPHKSDLYNSLQKYHQTHPIK
jgi:hypothetical protein